ncbi:DUF5683 domain-containing protein [Psychroserpens ponticola]|uniref:DUF5683 domain-containing protein n=1 Tax=Psychroserpens ponticola TaxID=2932268 RepID=A0ABY7RZL2_9FLAO|nr:DUF5683 domain-containing protein [Psychroserpens ponticola]WCO02579.1 DUF5683 domain-containing protein [Psychroserpens ponticola]
MPNKHIYLIGFLFFFGFNTFAQNKKANDSLGIDNDLMVVMDTIARKPIDILAPTKAAFYSAVLPGLGQARNKKYWKIPIIYAALGTGVYFYSVNNKEYNRYRDEYKRRLAGKDASDGEFPQVSNEGLINAQQTLKRRKELSLLITIGIYALNIIDANVDAHLLQYNVDRNLAIKPHFQYNEMENSSDLGLTLNFKF